MSINPESPANSMAHRALRLCALVGLIVVSVARVDGALYYSGVKNQTVPTDEIGIYLNLVTGVSSTFAPSNPSSVPWFNFFFGGYGIGSSSYLTPAITEPASGNGDGLVVKALSMQEIGQALYYASGVNGSENHTGSDPEQFQPGEMGYIGFAYKTADNAPLSYGWMRVTIHDTGPGIIHDWAYETTPGIAVIAGVVPEPGLPALLLLAVSLSMCARRR